MKKANTLALLLGFMAVGIASADITLLDYDGSSTSGWTPGLGMTLSTVDDSAGIGSGDALKIATSSSNRRATIALSQAVTLGVDDAIGLTMDYRYLNGATTTALSLEVRFTDSVSGIYMGFALNPSSSASQTLVFGRAGDSNEGKVSSFNHGTAAQALTFAVRHVLDKGNSEANFDLAWAGNPVGPYENKGGTSTVAYPFTFDTLSIGITGGSSTDGLLLDNVVVTTTIPEPAVLGLMAFVGVAIMFLRRLH